MKSIITAITFAAMAMSALAAPQQNMSAAEMNKVLFDGLFGAERAVAEAHWHKLTLAERDVLMKRVNLCMADSHSALMKMTTPPSNADVEAHMVGGLSDSEAATMRRIVAQANVAERAVGMRILHNACMYGVEHVK